MKKKPCSQCQKEIDADAGFCPYCGKEQEKYPSKAKAIFSNLKAKTSKKNLKDCLNKVEVYLKDIVDYLKRVDNLYLKTILTIIAIALLIIAFK